MAQFRHRKLMMKVNQQLGSEEFYSLAYLMCVPDEIVEATQSDCDRTRILRYLEKLNIIGPRNYRYLVDALDTLGRRDLIMQITLEDPEGVVAKMPHVPQSMQPQQQAWLAKRTTMLCKKEKYIGCMKDLAVFMHSGTAIESEFSDLFLGAFSALTSEHDLILPQYQVIAAATLTELSLFWKRCPIIGTTFQQNRAISKVKPLISQCHICFDRFNRELPPSWEMGLREHAVLHRNKLQHPFGKFAREAHSVVHELSAELIGEQLSEEANKRTQEEFFVLESSHYILKYTIPINKWLMTMVCSASLSTTDASKISATLTAIVSDHYQDIASNGNILAEIVGEELMCRFFQDLLQDEDKNSDTKCDMDISFHDSLASSVSIVWHVALVMLAMMSLNYTVDHRALAIQQKLEEFFVSQRRNLMELHSHVARRQLEAMQEVLDHYKKICDQKISELVGGASESLDIVQTLFNYESS